MAIAIGLIIAVVSIALVAQPFLRAHKDSRKEEKPVSSANEALQKRRTIYHEMDTLQLDYEMGNIDEAVYQQQMKSFRIEAASLIRDQQKTDGSHASNTLEEEIKAYRKARKSATPPTTCPNCGFITSGNEKVCPLCNHSLENGSSLRGKN